MANLNNVGRAMLFSATLSSALILFSGGCSPSQPSSYRFESGPGAAQTPVMSNNIGENNRYGQGAGNNYDQLNDWNFNSRMGQKQSRKSSSNAFSGNQSAQNTQPQGRVFQQFDPGHPDADSDGFVTYNLPAPGNSEPEAISSAMNSMNQNSGNMASVKNDYDKNMSYNNRIPVGDNNSRTTNNNRVVADYDGRQNTSNDFNGWKPLGSEQNSQSNNNAFSSDRSYHAASSQQPILSQNYGNNSAYNDNSSGQMSQGSMNTGSMSSRPLLQPVTITGIQYGQSQADISQRVTNTQPVTGSSLVIGSKSSPVLSDNNLSAMRNSSSEQYEDRTVKTYGNGYAVPRLSDFQNNEMLPEYTSKKDIQSEAAISGHSLSSQGSRSALSVGTVGITPDQYASANSVPAVAEYNRYINPVNVVSNTQELIFNLEQLLKKEPDNLELQMTLRYAYAAHGEHDKALQELTMVPLEKQKESMALARAAILGVKAHTSADPMLANNALSAVKMLEDKIAGRADLKISNFKICSTVEDFGRYKVIPDDALISGRPREVVVYCELENYQYQKNDEDKFFTLLHAEITLYDASLNILEQLSEDVRDTPSFNKRKDFFLRGPFKVPALKPGKYQIVISIEDKIAGKRALAARYPFEVKGSPDNNYSNDINDLSALSVN